MNIFKSLKYPSSYLNLALPLLALFVIFFTASTDDIAKSNPTFATFNAITTTLIAIFAVLAVWGVIRKEPKLRKLSVYPTVACAIIIAMIIAGADLVKDPAYLAGGALAIVAIEGLWILPLRARKSRSSV